MQILVSICYPDGSPPDCKGRHVALDYGDQAQDILQDWLYENSASIQFPSGWMNCTMIEMEEDEDEEYGGRYVHVLVQENNFEKVPDLVARLH